ncbi:MAG: EVE domain-containing protein [Planctomycetes bacterium]|nr:EVE domain-containing protein [Planctomycetota bacterium]
MPRARTPDVRSRRYWLLKSEPTAFAFDDLWNAPGRRTAWDGVRNYQARNFLRDEVRIGDGVLFHHSSADPSGITGLAEVVGAAAADPTQFDARSPGYDPRARRADPPWVSITIRAVARATRCVTLAELRSVPELAGMALLKRGQRLSVQPVTAAEWAVVVRLAGLEGRFGQS